MDIVARVEAIVAENTLMEEEVRQLRLVNTAQDAEIDSQRQAMAQLAAQLATIKTRLTALVSEDSRRRIADQVHAANDSWLPDVVEKRIYDTAVDSISELIKQIAPT